MLSCIQMTSNKLENLLHLVVDSVDSNKKFTGYNILIPPSLKLKISAFCPRILFINFRTTLKISTHNFPVQQSLIGLSNGNVNVICRV
jgi:hypothetical protein